MISQLVTYDTIYALAADDGRQKTLFGDCQPLAREAFCRSLLTGGAFPTLWFELPLFGSPRFDLHVSHARDTLERHSTFEPGAGNGYDELFAWYSSKEEGGCGLAFSYDVSDGHIDDPSVTVNVSNTPLCDMGHFFACIADTSAARAYQSFADRIPPGWRIWYAGVYPNRAGSPVRIDCFVNGDLKEAYSNDDARLERDLRDVGLDVGPALRKLARPVLESPFELELQFDVLRDGSMGPTLGLSAYFSRLSPAQSRRLFGQGGATACLLEQIGRMGLCDERWKQLPGTSFATGIPTMEGPMMLYCAPTFVKLRMRNGTSVDAKAYLQAGARLPQDAG